MVVILRMGALLLTGISVFMLCLSLYDNFGDMIKARSHQYAEWMKEQFDSMFIDLSLKRCQIILWTSTLLFAILPLLLLNGKEWTWGWSFLRLVMVLIGLKIGWSLPRFILKIMWGRRVAKFDDQMLDALVLMSNALKAGLSFIQAMDTVRQEMPDPIGQEFGLVLRHQQLGGGVNESLQQLEVRMGSEDVKIIVTAIMILRDTGGNLSETFDTIAFTIRERKKVKGKIEALTAQGVMQGAIIFCMPFGLGTILYVMDPVLISRMWETIPGLVLVIFMIMLQAIGGYIMKKVVTIEV